MNSNSDISFDEFLFIVNKFNPAILDKNAEIFWQKYYPWYELRDFLEKMIKRTNLPLITIFDLESAYQLLLASKNVLLFDVVIEGIKWNESLKICLEKFGAEKFISNYHCHPDYIHREVNGCEEIKSRIEEKFENSKILELLNDDALTADTKVLRYLEGS